MKANNKFKLFKIQAFILPCRVKIYSYKIFKIFLRNLQSKAALSAMERMVSSLRIFSFHQPVSQQHNFRKT